MGKDNIKRKNISKIKKDLQDLKKKKKKLIRKY